MPPSREALTIAVGKILFLKLSKEDAQQLFKDFGAKPNWESIRHFTRQALTSEAAARLISSHFTEQAAVLHQALEPQVFLGGSAPCVADVACYIALIPAMLAFPDSHKWALCNVSRWFDHMQHTISELKPPPELGCGKMVTFNYDMPTPPPSIASLPVLVGVSGTSPTELAEGSSTSKSDKGGESGKAAKGAGGEKAATDKGEAKEAKKEKKEKKEKAPAPPAASAAAGPDVSWADLRVGKIVEAKAHPDSDKLYIETIDLGEAAPRQILSGLAQHMPIEAVQGAMVVVIANLKARKIGGIDSQGMVLCAGDAGKTKLSFVTPPAGAAPGERVMFEGYEGDAETPQRMDKKKGWEAVRALHTPHCPSHPTRNPSRICGAAGRPVCHPEADARWSALRSRRYSRSSTRTLRASAATRISPSHSRRVHAQPQCQMAASHEGGRAGWPPPARCSGPGKRSVARLRVPAQHDCPGVAGRGDCFGQLRDQLQDQLREQGLPREGCCIGAVWQRLGDQHGRLVRCCLSNMGDGC